MIPIPNSGNKTRAIITGTLLEILHHARGHKAKTNDVVDEFRNLYGIEAAEGEIRGLLKTAVASLHPLIISKDGILRIATSLSLPGSSHASFFQERKVISFREKQAVAAYIHDELLDELDAIFMDAGSACEAIAWEMALGDKGHFTVMTNNMRAVNAFLTRPSIRIRITGGTYVVDDEALLGDGAVFDPDEYSVKHAIVGASGITATHVYNHSITGEEVIKRVYWRTPAQLLIVPATLRKFGGMDACCFGMLFKEKHKVPIQGDKPINIWDVFHNTIEEVRFSRRSSEVYSLHRHVQGFTASKCKIVIEPTWLIDEVYKNPEERNALQEVVDEINQNSQASFVEVVNADITRERLEASLERLASTPKSGMPAA